MEGEMFHLKPHMQEDRRTNTVGPTGFLWIYFYSGGWTTPPNLRIKSQHATLCKDALPKNTHTHHKNQTQSFWKIKTLRWGLFGLSCEEKQRKEERNQMAEIKLCEENHQHGSKRQVTTKTQASWKVNLRLYPVIINGHLFLPLYNQKNNQHQRHWAWKHKRFLFLVTVAPGGTDGITQNNLTIHSLPVP